jgi:hypothetical protein
VTVACGHGKESSVSIKIEFYPMIHGSVLRSDLKFLVWTCVNKEDSDCRADHRSSSNLQSFIHTHVFTCERLNKILQHAVIT